MTIYGEVSLTILTLQKIKDINSNKLELKVKDTYKKMKK